MLLWMRRLAAAHDKCPEFVRATGVPLTNADSASAGARARAGAFLLVSEAPHAPKAGSFRPGRARGQTDPHDWPGNGQSSCSARLAHRGYAVPSEIRDDLD